MSEVDTALKYILFPLYAFSAIFSGRLAKQNIKKQLVILRKIEPESHWATNQEMIDCSDIEPIFREEGTRNAAGIPFIVNK